MQIAGVVDVIPRGAIGVGDAMWMAKTRLAHAVSLAFGEADCRMGFRASKSDAGKAGAILEGIGARFPHKSDVAGGANRVMLRPWIGSRWHLY